MRIFVIVFCILTTVSLHSQERYFTQFYGAPILLDPSLTGNFDGNYRVNMAYRNQWSKSLENPFSVFAGSIDLNFNLGRKNQRVYDRAAAGIYFASDKAGVLKFGNTEMGVSGAYHKALSRGETLSGGLYMSINQRNINFSNVTYEDQFNGESGYTAPTGENIPENTFSYFDQGIGVNYANYKEKQHGFNIGLAIAHFTRPEISFYKNTPGAPDDVASFKLPIKYTAHMGGRIIMNDFVNIYPRIMYQRQGIQDVATGGANLKVDINVFSVHMGLWARGAGVKNSYVFDSAGILGGIEYNNWLVGVSYDVGIPNIIRYNRNMGTFEITLSYFGLYENDDLLCPTF